MSSEKKTPNPKRNLRFLVIYIMLLFSVSAIFLVTSFFANRDENLTRQLFEAQQEIEALERERDALESEMTETISDLRNQLYDLRSQRDNLTEYNAQLTADVERLTSELDALQTTHERYVVNMLALREELEELRAELAALRGQEGE